MLKLCIAFSLGVIVLMSSGSQTIHDDSLLSRVDHLVYATPDLDRGVNEIEKLLGVRATAGGQHPGRGTRNALVALGPTSYLEIIAPDPQQPPPKQPRAFGIDNLQQSKLVAWFVKANDLSRSRDEAVHLGVPYGEVMSGSRRRPDGTELSWHFTDPGSLIGDGVVPFLIDWGQSQHPATTAAQGATLVALQAEHPKPESVRKMLREVAVDLEVKAGPHVALIATIQCPRGRVTLR
jgi:Glyoxalase-like domain